MNGARTIEQIVKAAGGPDVIAKRIRERGDGKFSHWAVQKWPKIGVPDRHWPVLIELAETTPEELYAANLAARGVQPEAAA